MRYILKIFVDCENLILISAFVCITYDYLPNYYVYISSCFMRHICGYRSFVSAEL
jgi:hypothetical protein